MKTILFVDDDESVLTATKRKLHGFKEWNLLFAQSGREAIQVLTEHKVDAVVTDVAMPGMSGLDLLRHIVDGLYGFIPVVVVTGGGDKDSKRQALDIGAQDLLSKPVDFEDLVARLRSVLALKSYHDELEERNSVLEDLVAMRTEELASSRLELVVRLSKAAELRDHETGNHVLRVAAFARCIAIQMGMNVPEADELFLAATLHDIGKIGIPDGVLRKPGALRVEERQIIESHCHVGHEILNNRESAIQKFLPRGMKWGDQPHIMKVASEVARSHHEWWDGTGYPDRLKGDEIPLVARIVSIADVFDALRSERPYKRAFDWEKAIQVITDGRSLQFDPAVYDAFMEASTELREFDEVVRRDDFIYVSEAA